MNYYEKVEKVKGDIEKLKTEKEKYEKMKGELNSVQENISKGIRNLQEGYNNLNSGYTSNGNDDLKRKKTRISNKINYLQKICSKIRNNMISECISKISSKQKDIERKENEIVELKRMIKKMEDEHNVKL